MEFFRLAKENQLEGIVAKLKDSIYIPGKRTKDWIKMKNLLDEDFVVCGWIDKSDHVSSLVLGQFQGKELIYQGPVSYTHLDVYKRQLLVGHTEAIVTGALAGYNSVRCAEGLELFELPRELAIGDAIAFVKEEMATDAGMGRKYTFSGSYYFTRMKKLDLYTTDAEKIRCRVNKAGLTGIFTTLSRNK